MKPTEEQIARTLLIDVCAFYDVALDEGQDHYRDTIGLILRTLAEERERALKEAASVAEHMDHECDHDLGKIGPTSHPGGMRIVLRYRDAIRALKERT